MAGSSNIPWTREPELMDWMENLFDRLETVPTDFGITADQLIPYATAYEAFKTAFAVTQNPETKTKPAVATKNAAKQEAVRQARLLISVLRGWPQQTEAKLDALRIPAHDVQPTPIGPPTAMPRLNVVGVSGSLIDLEVTDEEGRKRKPNGVRACWLYSFVGDQPPASLTAWQFRGESTRSTPQVVFEPEVLPGTKVWVTALWVNPTGQPGPACAPVQTRVGYLGLNEAA
ncbi:MAG: hypothetical protein AAGF84_01220 [Planctomycetota bacterium]